MAEYAFVTVWRLEAPIDRVYDLIRDSLHQETPARAPPRDPRSATSRARSPTPGRPTTGPS